RRANASTLVGNRTHCTENRAYNANGVSAGGTAIMDMPLVLLDAAGPIATLTLNHPEKRNALSRGVLSQLRDHLKTIGGRKDVRGAIRRAEGPVFSSGHDLRELEDCSTKDAESLFALCTEVMLAIRHLPQPVIAEVQGIATAAGCQLAVTCDLVVAA